MPVVLHGHPTRRARSPLAASWRLAAGHYVPAKITPEIIGPSAATEAETDNAWSRYRRCPSAIAYRVPVAVLGGAWPFYYELTTAPTGMTIGAQYGDTDYGIINWSNPTVGDHSVAVKVTDQDGTEVTRSWTLEVIDRENTTYFMFLDAASGDNANDGSYSSPKQTLLGWYGAVFTTSTHAGKQVFYRSGTYHMNVVTDYDGFKLRVFPAYKPQVHVCYPGETATIDADLVTYFYGLGADSCLSGLDWANGWCQENYQAPNLGRMTYLRLDNAAPLRGVVFENYFGPATDYAARSGSNPATIFIDTKDAGAIGFIISHNTVEHNSGEFVEAYGVHDLLGERNTFIETAGTTEQFYLKSSGNQRWTIRANTGAGRTNIVNVSDGVQSETDHSTHDIETCWNSYRATVSRVARHQASSGAEVGNIWWYRNSFSGVSGTDIEHNTGNARYSDPVVVWEKNVIQNVSLLTDTSGDSICNFTNDSPDQTDVAGWLNATTNLLEGDGLAYLGTHGAEVA